MEIEVGYGIDTLASAIPWPSRKGKILKEVKEERGAYSVLLKGGPWKSQSPFHLLFTDRP